ncbi:MAG: hypothetical protein ACI8TP_004638 [Acidimicrobiales bacterium]|jgi:hypothetical protein
MGLVTDAGLTRDAVVAVARRPDLWSTAARTAFSVAPAGWWRRTPFLPLPDRGWMHFRLETAYGGDGTGPMRSEDLVTYLEWRRDFSS